MRLLGLIHVIDLVADSLEAEKKGNTPAYSVVADQGLGKCEMSIDTHGQARGTLPFGLLDSGCSLAFPVGP